MDECGFRQDPSRVRRLGLPSDYPSVNVLGYIPLFDGFPVLIVLTFMRKIFCIRFKYYLWVRGVGHQNWILTFLVLFVIVIMLLRMVRLRVGRGTCVGVVIGISFPTLSILILGRRLRRH